MQRHVVLTALVATVAGCSGGPGGSVNDPMGPGSGPFLTYTGSFHPVAHAGSGMAQVYVSGISTELEFTSDFATQGGPNLEVWLVAADDAGDSGTVLGADHVGLGPLKSPTGGQTYAVPAGTDFSRFRSVTVWCVSAKVNFTTAPLTMK